MPNDNTQEAGKTEGAAATKAEPRPGKRVERLPPWNVVLLNDDDHTFEYVIEMLRSLFGHPEEKGYRMAKRVNDEGRVVVLTTHKEKAELKRDQIHAFGADARVATCKGAMSAVIEEAAG